jgi:UPF0755 protein
MPKQRTSCFTLIVLITLAGACLAALLLAGALIPAMREAERAFGAPAETLGPLQRILLSARLVIYSQDLKTPADPAGAPVEFQVELGEPAGQVIARLAEAGLVKNPEAFRAYLQYSGLDTSVQAGDYTLSPAMTPVQIAHTLQDATPGEVRFGVLAGWRLEEIAAALPTSGLSIDPQAFLEAARMRPQGYSFSADLPQQITMEGFLFPDVYKIKRYASADDLIASMLSNFDQKVTPELRQGFARQGLTLYEAVTLASIVQREAVVPGEMDTIASVFLNRLAAGMKLDSDPTVQYALGYEARKNTWWTNPLTSTDVDSPYNTYLYPGLPPGPIDNPGLEALEAVAYPQSTPYYYFRAACDGSGRHNFARTYQEHLDNACR